MGYYGRTVDMFFVVRTQILAQTRLLVGDDVVNRCYDASLRRGAFYRAKNAGKMFLPSTVLFSESVDVCARCIAALLCARAFPREEDALRTLDAFREAMLPRFYQDAVHVRKQIVLGTFDRGALKCVYPVVLHETLHMKGGVRNGTVPSDDSYPHRALSPADIETRVMVDAFRAEDGCALLIAQDCFLYATKMACDPDLRAQATEWAFAPESPWVEAAAERFSVFSRGAQPP